MLNTIFGIIYLISKVKGYGMINNDWSTVTKERLTPQ
jgi:hypothetical protein